MREYPALVAALVLLTLPSVSCAQSFERAASVSPAAGPEVRWKFETGG